MSLVRRITRSTVAALALPAALLALWWVLSADSESYYLPPLADILANVDDVWLFSDRLSVDVLPSVLRLLGGFLLAVLLGVSLGTAIGSFRRVRAFCEPVLEFLRAIPPPVLVPVLMLFAGIGDAMKVLVIVSGCLWPILLNTVEGVRAVDEVLVETSRCYGVRGPARLWHLVLRSASPQIVTGMRQGLSVGIILMVISEMFAASNGLGFSIIQFQRTFAVTEMWTGILLLGVLGFLLALLMRLFEQRVLKWYFGLRQAQRGGSR
ncbi:ABC-type nitrate/sulfonate/bicarbonate transport system, permease component [Micromonospora rhizosphaerae]|uniref:ABC-type nitrate/sulfonate/bicarbonate transport system, permease component n=1 Tax=Micromonospora rhizosphaerae TaxID=568872 RepID=A0A1C6SWS2_9ACTN|nr:ABC transporter permease [Micromonospora rhizosphaerae]SCL33772.1 ABC-type nitrate/sulfonate/bicarbonate transport system, permease component [Micromonospora rhizosphaerae]